MVALMQISLNIIIKIVIVKNEDCNFKGALDLLNSFMNYFVSADSCRVLFILCANSWQTCNITVGPFNASIYMFLMSLFRLHFL